MTRSRMVSAVALSLAAILAGGSAQSAVQLEPVVRGSARQYFGFANDAHLVYTRWMPKTGERALARPIDGGPTTKLNGARTEGAVGGFDPGTNRVIYQQFKRNPLAPVLLRPGTLPVISASGEAMTVPGANGKIVFARDGNVWTGLADGTGIRRLTSFNNSDTPFPAWSPGGTRIAFSKNGTIFVMATDGSGLVSLGVSGTFPDWSPDGTMIAFTRTAAAGGGLDIAVMNANGTSPTTVIENGWAPVWSPDGSRIAFHRFGENNNYDIWIANPDGSEETQITDNAGEDIEPSWSPDGGKLAFRSDRDGNMEIYVMNADGSDQVNLSNHPAGDGEPAWSPDGTRIVFASSRSGGGLVTMNSDGSNPQKILSNGGWPDWQPLQVSLTTSSPTVRYGTTVTLTAHLTWHQTSTERTVSIYATPIGGPKTLLIAGEVDGSGNLSTQFKPAGKTVLTAEWSGDGEHLAGDDSKTILVRAVTRGRFIRSDRTKGRYALYEFTRRCIRKARGCPTFRAEVRPNHGGTRVPFELQLRLGGRWRRVNTFRFRLNEASVVIVTLVYGSDEVRGIPARLRFTFRGDADHLASVSRWSYFKVVP